VRLLHSIFVPAEAEFLGKIAVDRAIGKRRPTARTIASKDGWSVCHIVCHAGPADHAFEEQHSRISVAVVLSGTFQYRTSTGTALMTPGSLLLGNPRESFECGHEHGVGDECISFHFSEEFCERSGVLRTKGFRVPRVPAIQALSPIVARVSSLARGALDSALCEETALQVLHRAASLQDGVAAQALPAASSLARVTRVVRAIEAHPAEQHELSELAASARLSPFHFLRCFESLTGTTPRQYILRTRLRCAATLLKESPTKIIEIAMACGFGDISNFNLAFRREFGTSPGTYRRT
jgi:AraC family transcriptional regulator